MMTVTQTTRLIAWVIAGLIVVGILLYSFGQGRRVAHAALRQFYNLRGDEPCRGIVAQAQPQFSAHGFQRE